MEKTEIFLEVARIVAQYDIADDIYWTPDLRVFAFCSDTFDWAVADGEPIQTDEDVKLFLQSVQETASTGNPEQGYVTYGAILYASRKRNKKPKYPKTLQEPPMSKLFEGLGK